MITVIGCDGGPLEPAARDALVAATCVAGAERNLQQLPVPGHARRITLGALEPALDEVCGWTGPAVVAASGDPGFFGAVRALRTRGVEPRVVPAVSSVALAFARLGLPWDDVLVVSAHGRDPHPALAGALAHPKAAILTAPKDAGAGHFVGPLLEAGRAVYVAECLGGPRERLMGPDEARERGPDEFAHPNVVLAIDEQRAVGARPEWVAGAAGIPDGWALPEDAFVHRDSMITKAEVRSLALARLGPGPGRVVWDIGAGSGSVAIECARFGAYAVAFDRDPDQCARIRDNAAAHGVYVDVVHGAAPESLRAPRGQLEPDAVFLGGGGPEVLEAGPPLAARRVVAALAAVDKVQAVRDVLARCGYVTGGAALQPSRFGDLPTGAVRLQALNPVFLVWGQR